MAFGEIIGRTLAVNGGLVRQLRLQKGWSPEQLASHARCSVKTVKNVEASKKIYLATLNKIAHALGEGSDPGKLLKRRADYVQEAIPLNAATMPTRVDVIFQGDIQELDEVEDLQGWMRQLVRGGKVRGKIIVIAVTEGSIRVEVEMSDTDCLSLIGSYIGDNLNTLDILYMHVPIVSPAYESDLISMPVLHPLMEPQNRQLLNDTYIGRYRRFRQQLETLARTATNKEVVISPSAVTIINK